MVIIKIYQMGSKDFLNLDGGQCLSAAAMRRHSTLVCEAHNNGDSRLCGCDRGISGGSSSGGDSNCMLVLFVFCLGHVRSQPSSRLSRRLSFLQGLSEAPSFLIFPVTGVVQIVDIFFIFHTQQPFKPPCSLPHFYYLNSQKWEFREETNANECI
ncbi:hypothetical protein Hanom_Chr09g00867191 [Helianthus anomalus]